jgi:hypothetical protein
MSAALALTVTVGVGVTILLTTAVVATWTEVRAMKDILTAMRVLN